MRLLLQSVVSPVLTALWVTCLFSGNAYSVEMKDPRAVFPASSRWSPDGAALLVKLNTQPGHYLYKDRFKWTFEPESAESAPAEFPAGEWIDDENFGKVEVYRAPVTIRLPVAVGVAAAQTFKLRVTAQGCAEAGICYAPFSQTLTLTRPKVAKAASIPGKLKP